MSHKSIHLICNAHLDPVWQWSWEEGLGATLSTFRTAAGFCEEFEGFIFNHNEAVLYQWIEEYDPDLFSRIQKLVKEGKWRIIGGWYLQPDCNMPSGESFVRQILVGKSYFKEKFGVEPTTAINFDPFGHTRGLVQILAKSGYDSYMFCRPHNEFVPLESEQFVWVGFDGSEILATRSRGYGSLMGRAREKIDQDINELPNQEIIATPWGVGNHGGGPSRKDIADMAQLAADHPDWTVRHSTPEDYFVELSEFKSSLPRRENDLNLWAPGCYTSQIRIKQKHRALENEVYMTQKMASAAAFQGLMKYPKVQLDEALRDLLFAEFHDILPGSSVQEEEEASIRRMDHGLEIASRVRARAFFALTAGQPKAGEGHAPILVYNPHPFPVDAIVECELHMPDQNWTDSFTATPVFKNGKPIPFQNEKEAGNINLDWRKRVVFAAKLEPSSMNRFDATYVLQPKREELSVSADGPEIVFTNDEIKVVINTRTGLIDQYQIGGVDYLQPNCFEPLVIADNQDSWGMLVRSFREVIGRFNLMSPEAGANFSGVKEPLSSVRIIEDGAVRCVIEAVLGYGDSAICIRYHLPKKGTEIEVLVRVIWNEKDKMLKLSIPPSGKTDKYLGQVAYGVQELPMNGDEAVAQKWVATVSSDGRALTCINNCIYGSDFSGDGLRLTLLRSPAYTGHPIMERPIVRQDRYEPRIDQGERLFHFWLNAGPAEQRLENIDREALAKNEKPMALQMFPAGVERIEGKSVPFIVLEDEAIQMTAVKLAEDGGSLVVRLFEPTGKSRSPIIRLPFCDMTISTTLSPFEIKTLRIDAETKMVTETDLLERYS